MAKKSTTRGNRVPPKPRPEPQPTVSDELQVNPYQLATIAIQLAGIKGMAEPDFRGAEAVLREAGRLLNMSVVEAAIANLGSIDEYNSYVNALHDPSEPMNQMEETDEDEDFYVHREGRIAYYKRERRITPPKSYPIGPHDIFKACLRRGGDRAAQAFRRYENLRKGSKAPWAKQIPPQIETEDDFWRYVDCVIESGAVKPPKRKVEARKVEAAESTRAECTEEG